MQLQFLGAADTVTGSRHWVNMGGTRVLMDAGLFQGFKVLRERNWGDSGVDVRELDAVVLSHAHLDHSGFLPALVRRGLRCPIFATAATRDLAEVLLMDSAHLQEEDAKRANAGGYSRHVQAQPLYTKADAKKAIAKMVAVKPGVRVPINHEVDVQFTPAGHLLGAASITLRSRHETLVYSGDIGRQNDLLMPPPQPVYEADVLLVESTYGNRIHSHENHEERLVQIITDTVARGGSLLFPAFAVGRAQALLLMIQRLKAKGLLPTRLPVYLDSPMAIEATHLYQRHRQLLKPKPRELAQIGDGVIMVAKAAQSMKIAMGTRWPSIIISASGMATGGRVLHHLKAMAPDPRHHIVLAGFQVAGTRGARLAAGEPSVKIHGEMIPVRAQVTQLEGFSGHADANELMQWLGHFRKPPQHTFVVHGEPSAADSLRLRIQDELQWSVQVPSHMGYYDL